MFFQGSQYDGLNQGSEGPALYMYIFDQSRTHKFYKVYVFVKPGLENKEQTQVDSMVGKLDCKGMYI